MHTGVKFLTTTHNSAATVHSIISSGTQRVVLTTQFSPLLLCMVLAIILPITIVTTKLQINFIPVVNGNPKPVLLQTKDSKHKESLHWETHTRTIPRLELHSIHTLVRYIVDNRVAYVCQLVHLEVNQQEKEHVYLHDGTHTSTKQQTKMLTQRNGNLVLVQK